jgi:hypothetical protein
LAIYSVDESLRRTVIFDFLSTVANFDREVTMMWPATGNAVGFGVGETTAVGEGLGDATTVAVTNWADLKLAVTRRRDLYRNHIDQAIQAAEVSGIECVEG